MLNWVLNGNPRSPFAFDADRRKVLAATLPQWQDDRLPQRVERLYQLLHLQQDRPLVLYVHCEQGQVRARFGVVDD